MRKLIYFSRKKINVLNYDRIKIHQFAAQIIEELLKNMNFLFTQDILASGIS